MRTVALPTILVAGSAASAQVLLEVDITDPSAVVITATGAAAALDSAASVVSGATLADIFTADFTLGTANNPTGDLVGGGSGVAYNRSFNNTTTVGRLSLNLWVTGGGGASASFTTADPAFTGSATLDLSGASLAAIGSRGSVWSDDAPFGNPSQGAIIGEFLIVPAPGAAALLGLGGLAMVRRRR